MSMNGSGEGAYAFKPFAGSSHWLILKILEQMRPPLRICDVGTGEGFLSRECRSRGHYVVGIDSREAPGDSDRWDRLVTADLAQLPLRGIDPAERFDVVLLADILEHLPEPLSLLTEFSKFTTPRSLFIISVPNIANLYVRLSLLAGRFDYTDRGILDSGHLRFFTVRTFQAFLSQAGLAVDRLWATSIPFPLIWPTLFDGQRLDWINRSAFGLTNLWKTLLGYQLVAVARHVPNSTPSPRPSSEEGGTRPMEGSTA